MKRFLSLVLSLVFIFALSACGGNKTEKVYEGNGKSAEATETTVDLTVMNSTMVYAEVSQMMSNPEKYIGKKIKMSGTFTLYYNQDDETKTYYACIVKDATACCQQGLEFILKDGYEYPELDTEITVEGKFEIYDEDGNKYCRIADADLL